MAVIFYVFFLSRKVLVHLLAKDPHQVNTKRLRRLPKEAEILPKLLLLHQSTTTNISQKDIQRIPKTVLSPNLSQMGLVKETSKSIPHLTKRKDLLSFRRQILNQNIPILVMMTTYFQGLSRNLLKVKRTKYIKLINPKILNRVKRRSLKLKGIGKRRLGYLVREMMKRRRRKVPKTMIT